METVDAVPSREDPDTAPLCEAIARRLAQAGATFTGDRSLVVALVTGTTGGDSPEDLPAGARLLRPAGRDRTLPGTLSPLYQGAPDASQSYDE